MTIESRFFSSSFLYNDPEKHLHSLYLRTEAKNSLKRNRPIKYKNYMNQELSEKA